MKVYTKKYQSKSVTIQTYNDDQVSLIRNLMSRFVKPDIVKKLTTGPKLKAYSLSPEDYLEVEDMNVLKSSIKIKYSTENKDKYDDFIKKAVVAIKTTTAYLIKKLPLDNNILLGISGIDTVLL